MTCIGIRKRSPDPPLDLLQDHGRESCEAKTGDVRLVILVFIVGINNKVGQLSIMTEGETMAAAEVLSQGHAYAARAPICMQPR
jgi:hypothetical protein